MVLLLSSYSNKILVSVGKHRTEIKDFSCSEAVDFHKFTFKLAGFISQVCQYSDEIHFYTIYTVLFLLSALCCKCGNGVIFATFSDVSTNITPTQKCHCLIS